MLRRFAIDVLVALPAVLAASAIFVTMIETPLIIAIARDRNR